MTCIKHTTILLLSKQVFHANLFINGLKGIDKGNYKILFYHNNCYG